MVACLSMFWVKPKEEKIKSEEYQELLAMFEKLRIQFEAIKIDLELYKKKLRVSKGLKFKEDEEEEDLNSKVNKVIIPEK